MAKQVKIVKNDTSEENVTKSFSFIKKEIDELNAERTYSLLREKLKALGVDRLDPDVLAEAIDNATEWSYKASQLYIAAKDTKNYFEDVIFKLGYAELVSEAGTALEELKKQGKISGQVSKDKVENWIVLNKKDKFDELSNQLKELEMAVQAFESLSRQFESKKSLLQTLARLSERKKIVIGGND